MPRKAQLDLKPLAVILETTESNVLPRAAGLRILPTCSRCSGSGQHSYCQTYGTTCFQCSGSGQQPPRTALELSLVIESANATKTDGRFPRYLENLKAQRESKKAMTRLMAAWKAGTALNPYDWTKAHGVDAIPEAVDRADLNKLAYDAHKAFEDYDSTFQTNKTPGPKDWITYHNRLQEALAAMESYRQAVIAYNATKLQG